MAQINSMEGPQWKAWDQIDSPNIGISAMKAGQAAKRQGLDLFEIFHLELLKACHEDRKKMSDIHTINSVAAQSGLDMAKFEQDISDKQIIKEIEYSHNTAVSEFGVFGVPTFIFPNGASAYLKMIRPSAEKSVEVFESLCTLIGQWKNLGEIKRPQPPWPKGAFT